MVFGTFILAMIGWESISDKMKASMLEVQQSLSTWPQLASSVMLGGGAAADVCRRILLDQYTGSGRYYVDLESIISEPNNAEQPSVTLDVDEVEYDAASQSLTGEQMSEMANQCSRNDSFPIETEVVKFHQKH